MATLGKTTGATKTGWPAGYVQVAGPYTATEDGTINSVKIKVEGAGAGTQAIRAVVYANSAGNPGAKVAQSAEVTVLSAQAAGEVTFTFASGSIVNGSAYWIGYETGSGANIYFYKDDSAGASRYVTSATYPTAPDPFGSGTSFTDSLWAYIDYTATGGSPPVNTVAPAVTGTATVGQTLSCSTGTWTDGTPAFTYQWQRDVGGDLNFSNIASATSSTYVLVDADDGNKIRCVVTDTDEVGATTANSNAAGAVIEPKPTNSVAPVASGNPYIDATVSSTTGTWANQGGTVHTYQYQWQDSADGSTSWGDISGKTAATYVVEAGEDTKFLRCNVKATNTGGQSVAATATNVLGPVGAAPAPLPSRGNVSAAVITYYYS